MLLFIVASGAMWPIIMFYVLLEKCLFVINFMVLFKSVLIKVFVGVSILGMFGPFLGLK